MMKVHNPLESISNIDFQSRFQWFYIFWNVCSCSRRRRRCKYQQRRVFGPRIVRIHRSRRWRRSLRDYRCCRIVCVAPKADSTLQQNILGACTEWQEQAAKHGVTTERSGKLSWGAVNDVPVSPSSCLDDGFNMRQKPLLASRLGTDSETHTHPRNLWQTCSARQKDATDKVVKKTSFIWGHRQRSFIRAPNMTVTRRKLELSDEKIPVDHRIELIVVTEKSCDSQATHRFLSSPDADYARTQIISQSRRSWSMVDSALQNLVVSWVRKLCLEPKTKLLDSQKYLIPRVHRSVVLAPFDRICYLNISETPTALSSLARPTLKIVCSTLAYLNIKRL